MKKVTGIILSTILAISFSACGTKTNPPSTTGNNPAPPPGSTGSSNTSTSGKTIVYKDGTYDVKHKSTKPGYEEAIVTIKSGKIQNIELKRLDDAQKEVNYNDWDGTKNGYPNLKQDRIDLANAMVSKQSSDVNVISGATQSSNGWKAAVSSALSKAQ